MLGSDIVSHVLFRIREENTGTLPPLLVVSDDSDAAMALLQTACPAVQLATSRVVTSEDVSHIVAARLPAVAPVGMPLGARQIGLVSSLVDQVPVTSYSVRFWPVIN
jgi:hypothetical protein